MIATDRLRPARALVRGLVCLSWLVLAGAAGAVPVYGTDASGELSGSRSVGGGLMGFNDYSIGSFTVDWAITIVDANTVHYAYTFTGVPSDISNLVIDLTDDCISDASCVTNPTIGGESLGVMIDIGNSSGIVVGVKLEGIDGPDGVTYEFDSNRLPVYGHLALKGGGGPETCADAPGSVGSANLVCSNGLLAGADTEDITDYVARPNGIVPEPGTGLLLALGMLGLARLRSRAAR